MLSAFHLILLIDLTVRLFVLYLHTMLSTKMFPSQLNDRFIKKGLHFFAATNINLFFSYEKVKNARSLGV